LDVTYTISLNAAFLYVFYANRPSLCNGRYLVA